jgi:hypothetical protein
MDRRKACLAQVKICRERAAADPGRRDFWVAEAAKWQRRANEEVHIAYQIGDGELAPRPRHSWSPPLVDNPKAR